MSKNRLMKVLAVISTAIMAFSAAGVTAAADEINDTQVLSSTENSTEKQLVLGSVQGAPGETVEVPLTMFTGSQCMYYDISVEFDSRLEFVESDMAQSSEFEENGNKFVSLAGFGFTPFADGETAATVSFRIPENANVNDSFELKIANVSNFASDSDSFENYSVSNGTVTAVQGVEAKKAENDTLNQSPAEAKATISLESKNAVAGEAVEIPVTLYSDNQCTSYDISIKYDSNLELLDVDGAMLSTPYEENGEKYVAIIGYKASPYKDGKAIAKLTFAVPEDLESDAQYLVGVNNVASLQTESEDFTSLTSCVNSTISVKSFNKKGFGVYQNGLFGDVNEDGVADIRDAALIARCVAGRKLDRISRQGQLNGDVNQDGTLDIRDAARIARYVAKGGKTWEF